MTADWWARGIAIGGATVTAFNVAIALATYRRVRPRVRLKGDAHYVGDRILVGAHFTNEGASPVHLDTVRGISVAFSPAAPKRRYLKTRLVPLLAGSLDIQIDAEPEKHASEVPAFSGVDWVFSIPLADDDENRIKDWLEGKYSDSTVLYVQLKARLMSGEELASDLFPCPYGQIMRFIKGERSN